MGRRGSPAAFLVFLAVLAVLLAALPHLAESSGRHHHHHGQHSHLQSRGHGDEEQAPAAKVRREWPCCDNCGSCTKSIPPQCQCMDAVRGGCHPACRDCVKSALSVHPPVYQCMDRIPNFCQRRCNAVAAH
ncbi:uncharacterized protein [Lolium perenne]|uniref:uncharacterized protein n=1 Tax=Lolium perenne TaxID=4522 RepID=UPI0021F5034A|nr:Bowman-Birk type trypsin inhibitor-like [Lolium perenne]